MLLCAGLGYFVYSNWQSWLESLDGDRKITAYALVGQNEFTTYPDVQDVLLKMGSLKGFWGQDVKQIQEQLETIPWIKRCGGFVKILAKSFKYLAIRISASCNLE